MDRVAVGHRHGDVLRGDIAACARLVVDDDRLTKVLAELLRDDPGGGIGAASRGEADGQRDGPAGEALPADHSCDDQGRSCEHGSRRECHSNPLGVSIAALHGGAGEVRSTCAGLVWHRYAFRLDRGAIRKPRGSCSTRYDVLVVGSGKAALAQLRWKWCALRPPRCRSTGVLCRTPQDVADQRGKLRRHKNGAARKS